MSDFSRLFAQVAVRYRGEGLLRLELPPFWRRPALGRYLVAGLQQVVGIRRVAWEQDSGRLAIHYQDTMINDRQVARQVAQLLERVGQPSAKDPAPPQPPPAPGLKERLLAMPALRNTMQKLLLWRAQASAVKLMIGQQMENRPALQVFGKNPETAVINFINEMVTFYLIRIHWSQITQVWLRQPLRHYKEWLTLFYLVFLLVRSCRGDGHDQR